MHAGIPLLLLLLAAMLALAKLGGALFERRRQPAVLGELCVGLLLGNLGLVGLPELRGLLDGEALLLLAELGAVVLLFKVGLESTVAGMLAVGGRASVVAGAGVVAPMILGFGVGALTHPHEPLLVHAFLGAMLAATSVGITARVLADLKALDTPAARIILGAAVIDDVLGLIVLAVVSGVITAASTGTALAPAIVLWIVGKAVLFLAGAVWLGSLLSPRLFRTALALPTGYAAGTVALVWCLVCAYLAALAGLAPIVGAFAAGLVLHEEHAAEHVARGESTLEHGLAPLAAFLVPIFFVRMGMLVDLSAFASWNVLGFALLLTLAAVVGKQVCGLFAPEGTSPLVIGLGMMPRGEVGLIFAGIGSTLVLGGKPVVDASTYAAAIFMVMATTIATPPLLSWALRRRPAPAAA